MVTELTDMDVRGVGVIAVRRSAVPRSVKMGLLTAQTAANYVGVKVCLTTEHSFQFYCVSSNGRQLINKYAMSQKHDIVRL